MATNWTNGKVGAPRPVVSASGATVKPMKLPTTPEKAARNVLRSKKPDMSLRNHEGRQMLREMVMPELGLVPVDIPPCPGKGHEFTPERIDNLVQYMANGGILQRWLKVAGVSRSRYQKERNNNPAFKEAVDEAVYIGCDALADRAMEVASRPFYTEDEVTTVLADGRVVHVTKKADNVYARKLAVQTTLDILQRRAPDRYGNSIEVKMTDSRAQAIINARNRLREAKQHIVEGEILAEIKNVT